MLFYLGHSDGRAGKIARRRYHTPGRDGAIQALCVRIRTNSDGMLSFLPTGLTLNVLNNFMTESSPSRVALEDVSKSIERLKLEKTNGKNDVFDTGAVIH